MFAKLKLFFQLFQFGKEVGNKLFWKQAQSTVLPAVVGGIVVVLNLLKSFGIEVGLDETTIYYIAGSLYMLINSCLTFITSKHAGIGGMQPGAVGEAQQAMPSNPTPAGGVEASTTVQSEHQATSTSRFDDETIRRAREWAERQGIDGKPVPEGQNNPFNTMG
jgi:hypothetical protein